MPRKGSRNKFRTASFKFAAIGPKILQILGLLDHAQMQRGCNVDCVPGTFESVKAKRTSYLRYFL